MRACRGEATPVKPVWIMRQAGRYLPEYREVRSRFPDFLAFCANPEAAAEVTVQPIRRFGLDAAILFSDILVGLPPQGLDLQFKEGHGPQVSNPVRSKADLLRLRPVDVEHDLAYTRDAIGLALSKLPAGVPLLGFVGGPLTVASYAIEGKSSKELKETKKLLYGDPATFHAFMQATTDYLSRYLVAQAKWGCSALVVMDSWAGYLSPADYALAALPYTRQLVEAVRAQTKVPVIHYANGASHLFSQLVDLRCDVLGLDWRLPLEKAIAERPGQTYQGNLDPCALYAPPARITSLVDEMLSQVKGRAHIMNLGHGILPDTPIEGVEAFIRAIRNP